jgi:hypothetical protein
LYAISECQVLIDLLYHEVGKRWMSLELKLQIEKIEGLLRERPMPVAYNMTYVLNAENPVEARIAGTDVAARNFNDYAQITVEEAAPGAQPRPASSGD